MKRIPLVLSLAATLALLAGCYSSGVERNWGRAQRVNFTAQVANPEAPASLEVPGDMDPSSSEQAMAGHRKRSADKIEQQQMPSLISIGTSISER